MANGQTDGIAFVGDPYILLKQLFIRVAGRLSENGTGFNCTGLLV
jgi:hypothetical protein